MPEVLWLLTCLYMCALLQGKVVHQSFSIQSSFTQKVRLQQIRSLTEDIRFYYKRLRNNKDELEPRRKSKVAPLRTVQSKWAIGVLININLFSFLFFRWQIFILTPACSVVITVMWGCRLCLNVSFFSYCLFVCNIKISQNRVKSIIFLHSRVQASWAGITRRYLGRWCGSPPETPQTMEGGERTIRPQVSVLGVRIQWSLGFSYQTFLINELFHTDGVFPELNKMFSSLTKGLKLSLKSTQTFRKMCMLK